MTYCFKLIVDEKKAHLYVSDPIERDKQYFGAFFILLLRYPSLTPKGFDDVKILLDKTDKKFNIDVETTVKLQLIRTIEEEIYYRWICDAEVFVYNSNYVLAKYNEEFVIKCCDKLNSSKKALDEIRNEIDVLKEIKIKLGKNNVIILLY